MVGEWLGGEEAASDVSQPDAAFEGEGRVPIAGHAVRLFSLSEPGPVRIEVRGEPSGDPYVAVIDAAGLTVAEDDDSLGSLGSLIEEELDAGTYCLAIRSYDPGMARVFYAVGGADASFGPGDPDVAAVGEEPRAGADGDGECFEAGTPRLGGALDAAAIAARPSAVADGIEAIGFTLTEPAAVTITATSVEGDPLIRLLDARFGLLAENDDHEGLDSRIDAAGPLPAGDYCVEVEDLNGDGHEIVLELAPFDPAADRARRLALAEIAPTAGDGVEVAELGALATTLLAEVAMRDGARWFAFDLPEGGLVTMDAIGDGADPVLALFDKAGRRMRENDDGPDGFDSRLVEELMPGRYVVAVRLAGTGGGSGAVRLLLERFVRAR